jgi:hypothetical protein
MKKFLLIWVSLAFVLVVGTALASYFLFNRIDLRFAALAQLAVIPIFQAAVLMWVIEDWSVGRFRQVLREVRTRVVVLALLAVDFVVLGLGWALRTSPAVGLAGPESLQPAWTGVKAFALAVALGGLAAQSARPLAERIWLGLASLGVVALGGELFRPWLGVLPDRLLPSTLPTVLKWLVVYGGIYLAAMIGLVHTGTVLRRRSPLASFFIDGTCAVAFLAGVITALSIFFWPYLVEPWASVVRTCLSLAATFALAGCLSALSERRAVSR